MSPGHELGGLGGRLDRGLVRQLDPHLGQDPLGDLSCRGSQDLATGQGGDRVHAGDDRALDGRGVDDPGAVVIEEFGYCSLVLDVDAGLVEHLHGDAGHLDSGVASRVAREHTAHGGTRDRGHKT